MLRIPKTVVLVTILILPSIFLAPAGCVAQDRRTTGDYDFYSLAVMSISTSATEAAKLPEVPQRIKLFLYAAKILPSSQHDEAILLLEAALRDLKQWGSDDKTGWYQRYTIGKLRNEIVTVYAALDPEKAIALRNESEEPAESNTSNKGATSRKDADWFTQFKDRETIADQTASIGLSLIETDSERALGFVVQSLQGGMVSHVIFDIVQKLSQEGNRGGLDKLEIAVGQALAANVTFHWSSLSYAAGIVQFDKAMPPMVRSAFVSFFIRSLQAWSSLIKDPGGNNWIDRSYIETVFTRFSLSVRPVIIQYSPEQLLIFDLSLNQAVPLIREQTRSRLQAFQPETFSEPRDQLNDILKDGNSEKRDLRLERFVSRLLHTESDDPSKNLDLAAEGVAGFSDDDIKAAFTDLLSIFRVKLSLKHKNFIEAQRVARSISSDETRAWALLALSLVATKTDRVLGFELISNALTTLDKTSPSPQKVELALIAAGMLAKSDPARAFDTLSTASRYANSTASKIDLPAKPPVAFGLEATIGEATTRLGVFPENLGEVKIDPSLSTLATSDWFRANQIADSIREPALRLRLKLEFAEAMITQGPKPKKKDPTKKPS